jgi:hypothetical protein
MWVINDDGYAVNLARTTYLGILPDNQGPAAVVSYATGGKLGHVGVARGFIEDEARQRSTCLLNAFTRTECCAIPGHCSGNRTRIASSTLVLHIRTPSRRRRASVSVGVAASPYSIWSVPIGGAANDVRDAPETRPAKVEDAAGSSASPCVLDKVWQWQSVRGGEG